MPRPYHAALVAMLAFACNQAPTDRTAAPPRADTHQPWFVEAAESSGLDFVHVNGMSGKYHYAEIIGSGVALLDYDNDGDLDVLFVQGQPLDDAGRTSRSAGPSGPAYVPLKSQGARLFRNDLRVAPDGTRTLHFTDVTRESHLETHGYGMGVAVGDIDNDGCVDVYVTNLGANQLFRNNCDGTFTDVTKTSGTAAPSWSVSAAFLDYDLDGYLDLFVGGYLNYTVEGDLRCAGASGRPDYCSPNVYRPLPSHLFHNNGNGTFTDVTAKAGMSQDFGPALGVSTADFDGDGWMDIFVADDRHENQLWMNQHDGTFRNLGVVSGAAMSAHGLVKSGMGVDAGDVDNDGDEDIVVTNLTGEGTDVYVNDGRGTFEETAARSGVAYPSLGFTGFGTAWFDVDNDGWLDLLAVNGAVRTIDALRQRGDPFPFHQTKLLFRNAGVGRFEDATSSGGPALALSEVSRGAAFGDVDNDGDVDVVVSNNNGRARLLLNQIGSRKHWLGVRLTGTEGSRDMLGARLGVVLGDGTTRWRRSRSDGSYASANDPRIVVGLGDATAVRSVQIVWPDGRKEERTDVPIDRYTTIAEGVSK